MAKMMKRNIYSIINGASNACSIVINRWLIGTVKSICNDCGIKFKIDDSSINESDDSVIAVFAAENEESYIAAAYDLHRECRIELL